MGRTPSRVHIAFAFLLATLPAGCGGGGAAFVQPPPLMADFTIQFSLRHPRDAMPCRGYAVSLWRVDLSTVSYRCRRQPGVQGGVDILDAHSGVPRMRIFLLQQFMTDIDGLHGGFLTTDENGQRLFATTSTDGSPQNSGITVVKLAKVPLGIGTLAPAAGDAAGGASITLRGSGFESGVTVPIGGKNAVTTFKDANTLTFVVPAPPSGSQQVQLKNPDGETVSLDAAFTAN